MTGTETRPAVTGWWNAGRGVWQRYYGRYTLTVRKRGVGFYDVTVTDEHDRVTFEAPSGTLPGAKSKGVQWVSYQ